MICDIEQKSDPGSSGTTDIQASSTRAPKRSCTEVNKHHNKANPAATEHHRNPDHKESSTSRSRTVCMNVCTYVSMLGCMYSYMFPGYLIPIPSLATHEEFILNWPARSLISGLQGKCREKDVGSVYWRRAWCNAESLFLKHVRQSRESLRGYNSLVCRIVS